MNPIKILTFTDETPLWNDLVDLVDLVYQHSVTSHRRYPLLESLLASIF